MANSDKDILITPGKDTSNLPELSFIGQVNSPIKLRVLDDNTLSFEGSSGQLFSINNNLTVGTIFSVNDVSGVPSIETLAEGLNYLSPYYGNTIVGPGSKTLTNITSSNAPLIIGRTQNTPKYDIEIRSNHGITDGNYGGITFKQAADGSTNLASIRLEYTTSGSPNLAFYTRSGNSEARRFHIIGGSTGNDGNVGIGAVNPNNGFGATPGKITVNTVGTHSEYNALTITSSTSNNTNKGAAICGMSYNTANPPWAGIGLWSTNGSNIIYFGGGGWGDSPEATELRFFSGSTQGASARATERWRLQTTGHFIPQADNTYDIGTTTQRVRNIFTGDLHLSNKGSKNDVDGSWGDWTIQEGDVNIFLLNNRNGKKYKFVLEEVK